MSENNTYEIIQAIHQAAANAYDGAVDKDGKPVEMGLRREEGHPINDSRVMDGFKVKINGTKLILSYQTDIKLNDLSRPGFETEIEKRLAGVMTWLKKEYGRISKNSLSVTKDEDLQIVAQKASNRYFITATCIYDVKGLGETKNIGDSEPEAKFDDFEKQGGWTGKKKEVIS